MGIPTYYRRIIENYRNTHFWDPSFPIAHLFIDFNAMIYQVISKIDPLLNLFDFERQLLDKTTEHLKSVVNDIIKPTDTLFIAMDGPPPRAKMVQQRARRYKTIVENNFKRDLEKKYKVTIPSPSWSSASISPGTIFMSQLATRIRSLQFCAKTVIFSDANEPGEGEHKLIPKIKTTKGNTAVYSPDADMIVLATLTNRDDIYILREPGASEAEKQYANAPFVYLSITKCRDVFFNELSKDYEFDTSDKDEIKEIVNHFLDDYSFITFLCGNDFVRHAPGMKVKQGGLELLLKLYKKHFDCYSLVENGNIDFDFLVKIIEELSESETSRMKQWQRQRDRVRKGMKTPNEPVGLTPWSSELLRFQHEEYYSPYHPQHEKYNEVFNLINYFDQNWVNQYNNVYFKKTDINDVCADYWKSIVFCWKYYQNSSPASWTWYYPHRAAPTMTDFSKWLKINKHKMPEFQLDSPFTPFEQLLTILPKNASNLLPSSLKEKHADVCCSEFMMDIIQGEKFIYSEPILPEVNIDTVRLLISKVQFSDKESLRNTVKEFS